ncbi:hypothetical protein HY251_19810, partial [bacterium]|nr:hypothetical protein [bacterium]
MIFSRRSPGAMLALASAIAGLTCARLQGEEPAFPEVCRGFLTTERTRLVSLLGSYAWKHASHVHSLSVSADGKRAVSGGEDGNLVLWEVPSGRELRTIENGASVYACAISPDGRLALTGSGAIVKLWDLETGKLVRSLEGHAPSEGAIAFSI